MAQRENETNTMYNTANGKIWQPGCYARLSSEDLDAKAKGVSLSIEHQLDILKRYVQDKNWQNPKIFYDDDQSGTSFANRKGFQDLYAEAEKGNINVILIHDISRFGRNWVQSGMYFERLADMGIRVIFVNEKIDTEDTGAPALKLLPFHFAFAEWYSQSTSEKVRAVFKNQAEQGKFRAKQAPFGYDKKIDDKHKLVIDPYAANIVKRIFEMRLEKRSYGAIAKTLNNEGIPSPSSYYAEKHNIENHLTRITQWTMGSVRQLLENPAYCGDVAHNKVGCASYKNQKQIRQPFENWIIVKDMHQPIVSREDWQKCFDMRKKAERIRSTKNEGIAPFTGLLKCPDCGYNLNRTNTYYNVKSTGERKAVYSYNCSTFARTGKAVCSAHYISEKSLMELVIADIREKAGVVLQDENAARERYYTIKAQSSGTKLNTDKTALKKVGKRLAELDKLLQAAFEKSVLGGDTSNMFMEYARKYEAEKQELTTQAQQLSESIEKQSQTESDVETFIALMKKYSEVSELDRATVVDLVDHITISASTVKPREVVIYYNFIGNVE